MSDFVIMDVGVILSPNWLEFPNFPFAMVTQGIESSHLQSLFSAWAMLVHAKSIIIIALVILSLLALLRSQVAFGLYRIK